MTETEYQTLPASNDDVALRKLAAADFIERLKELKDSSEFGQFSKYWEELFSHATSNDQTVFVNRFVDQARKRRRLVDQTAFRGSNYLSARLLKLTRVIIVVFCLSILSLEVADWIFKITVIPDLAWLQSSWQRALFIFSLALLLTLAYSYYFLLERRYDSRARTITSLDERWGVAADQHVTEAYRRAINRVLEPRGLLPFPSSAPDLVELATDKIAPSKTIQAVQNFVQRHSTSAIGIAGPRGSGKSTLMRAVSSQAAFSVSVLAASKYEPIDLLRRLAFAIDTKVNGGLDGSETLTTRSSIEPLHQIRARRRVRADRVTRPRAIFSMVLALYVFIGGGSMLIWFDWTDSLLLSRLGPLALLGAIFVIVGLFGTIYLLPSRMRASRVDTSAASMAQALAEELRAEMSESREAKLGLQVTTLLGLERTVAKSQTEREISYGDLVDRLRDILQRISAESDENDRVLIIVDELDKLPDVDSLTNVINAIKDLFRVKGVHFLVSVSDEALAAFELRGLRPRDAFDSSFDDIVEMARLDPRESLAILESRVAGFPERLGLFLSVWAGGLPRDLIRATRSCIDIARQSTEIEPWQSIAREFVQQDINKRRDALVRQYPATAPDELSAIDGWFSMTIGDLIAQDIPVGSNVTALRAFVVCISRALELTDTEFDNPCVSQHLSSLSHAIASISTGEIGVARALAASKGTLLV